MATPVGWSQGGSGSVCLAFDQLRDVIESQEELIHQLRNVEEKAAHAKTKVLLAKEEEKLQFALGEVEVLSKQLEKEKLAFEKALSSVKSRALQESSKKDQLITKCNEIESHIIKQEDILNGKENEIKELQHVISQQKEIFRNHMSDFRIQKQQENYMAQVLDQKHKKASGTRQARSHQRAREK
ncbi:spermatogenesis-associated protein 24 isoform X2 [Camelus ferus]|uniref:Spermatogenesis-associated protein 24 isoform X2 n=2 Tax=Camelus TaxID=9836 RepID=A0A8B8SSJ7_CAMFR|nr:spermatogenesis-associated protein 24 isoform X2 [Camelus dromedarius]XP_032332754.1 spermatogenesis-associated protein 24 isoform X2 [Camelus ferus]XP_045363844.1 spermatogenesis-associated protein 24 isoform X2 [Camelus bactrianus]